jgi:hypothetical protein
MARQTLYIVQSFSAGRRGALQADTPVPCLTAAAARRSATRLADSKLGVIAFASSGDVETGDYDDEPVILFKAGRLPPSFDELTESVRSRSRTVRACIRTLAAPSREGSRRRKATPDLARSAQGGSGPVHSRQSAGTRKSAHDRQGRSLRQ